MLLTVKKRKRQSICWAMYGCVVYANSALVMYVGFVTVSVVLVNVTSSAQETVTNGPVNVVSGFGKRNK